MNARKSLQPAVQRYLKERRQLGFELTAPATELMRFARSPMPGVIADR